ncbi:hypothetical protein JCM10908_000618 [Rhodotorula pacifica]|uniref:uncharacterized protein n=1 Tax=Rhodotorula pacifica TaxID=1495444 RepID=UPI00317D62C1
MQQQQPQQQAGYAQGGSQSRSPPTNTRPTLDTSTRYSSADLYSLQHSPTPYGQRPSVDAARRLTNDRYDADEDERAEDDDNEDDDEDEDDGPGFASHGDMEDHRQQRRRTRSSMQQAREQQRQAAAAAAAALPQVHQYQVPTQQYQYEQQQQQQFYQPYYQQQHYQQPMQRMSMPIPPPIVSHPSRLTTKSAFDFTLADPGAAGAGASTSKIDVGGDLVDAPILSKTDWKRGEPVKNKHEHDAEKQKRKRDRVKGEVMDVGFGVGEFVKRNWKWIVPPLVFLSVAAILLCYFLIPRTPTITFDSPKAPSPAFTSSDTEPYISSADPTSFSFEASIAFAIDASASYLPVNYHSFDLTVRLQETGGIIAQQSYSSGEISVPGRRVTSYEFPITFAGNYTNANNPTYAAIRSACAHKYATIYRPPLNLTVSVSSSIIGVINPPTRIARLDAVECPVEWSKTAS